MRLGTTRWLLVGLLSLTLWPATVTPQETQWDNLNSAAVDAYQQADYAKAEKLLLAALKVAKKFGAQDPRLAPASTTWRRSTTPRANTPRPSHSTRARW